MATQVEVGTALSSLANLSELTNETKLQRTFASPLSDADGQPAELPLSPLLLEEGGPFGNALRPATMTPATVRPRLTPKPFCREKSAETFAIVKPPVPVLKPSTAAPKPPVFAKTCEDTSVARGLTGNVPPLVNQTLVESKASSDFVANMPFYSSPQANTVILFETGSTDRVRMTLTPDKNIVGVPRTLSILPPQEGKLPSSKSEMSYRRPESAGIHRQLSLSSESRPGPWNPCRPLERADTLTEAPKEKAKEEQKPLSSPISLASEGQARLKQRPVSAIFLESLKDQKLCAPDVSTEKPLLEKPWVRKPRPLSVDLTAKFENRDLSVQRKACPFDIKEKNFATHFTDVGCSRPSETGPKTETAGLGREDLSKPSLKAAVHMADSPGAKRVTDPQIHKPSPNEASSLCHSSPKDSGQISAKDRKSLWELMLKSQDEQTEREVDVVAASEERQEPRSSKGHPIKDKAVLDPKNICTISENPAGAGTESRSWIGGDVKKLRNLPDASANRAALENAKPFSTSPEKECRILNIQQRIKELTAENADAKPGNLRRSFRSRPLSSDLTKLFSSSPTSSEVRLERQAELNRKMQEVPENDARPLCGPDCNEPPWKPQQSIKTPRTDRHFEKDGSVARERQNAVLQGEGPPTQSDHGLNPHSVAATENTGLKTVRATVFEHSVQRHNVAVDRLGTEPVSQPVSELAGEQLGHSRELWLEKALESQTSSKKVLVKQPDSTLDAAKHGQAMSLKEGPGMATWEKYTTKEKLEKPTPKHIEDSLKYQRIEPRYEILQTVGERVQSEAVAAVSEDKAVTLRSRRSLKERRRTEESIASASLPSSLDRKESCWREDGSVPKVKDPGEAAVKSGSVKGCSVSHSQQVSHKQISEWNKSQTRQQQGSVRTPSFPSRNRDLGTADGPVSSLPSGTEKEKPEVCFSDKMQGSRVSKRFPESYGAVPSRTDGYEVRAHVSENMASAKAGEHESPSSPGGTSQWQKRSNKASPPSVDMRTFEQRDSRLRKSSSAYSAKEELGVSGHLVAGERFGQFDVEEGIRRSSQGVSAPKATERWRRKTLPHGTVRFEDVGAVAAESAKALSRRDSLQLHNSSIAKRNREPKTEAEPREGSPASPHYPVDSLRQPLSPSEPRETSYAAAENENAFDPLQSKPVSSAVENLLLSPKAGTSRRPQRQHSRRFPDTPGSLDRHRSKSWGEAGTPDLPRPGDARCENWRSLGQQLADAQERGARVTPLFQAEPKSPSYVQRFPQDRECLGPQNSSSCSWDVAKGKGTDGYRSQVLDIDALMAEYKDDSKREGGLSEERGKLACRRNSADKASSSYHSNSPKSLDRSPRSPGQGIHAAEFRWPEQVYTSEQMGSCNQEWSPLKAQEVALDTPPWGRLAAERTKYLPADSTSMRTKTFIVDEEHGESLVRRHQRAKSATGNAQLASTVHVDTEPGTGRVPCPSQGLSDAVSWKGTSPAQQAGVARSEDCRKTVHASGLSKRNASRVEARANWNSSEPGLADAPHDVKRSYSEKARQARVRGSLPLGQDVREEVHHSSLPERVNSWLSKRDTFQQDSSIQEGRTDREKEPPKQLGSSGVRSPPYLPARRRSRSFYKERRTDHWPVDHLKECFGRPAAEAKDTDTLVQEADSQYGTWSDQRHSGDSFVPESPSSESNVAAAWKQPPGSRLSSFSSQTDPASAADQHDSSRDQRSTSLDRSSTDMDSADGTEGSAPADTCPDFSFLDHTPVLDSSALKTRVQLSKRRRQHRAPISHSLRRSTGGDPDHRLFTTEEVDNAWMFQDCTEGKKDGSEEEEKIQPVERTPGSQPQRLPVFPGMDHSLLKAQLRKRQEMEGAGDGSPGQLSKSPKSPFQARALGGRVLPTGVEKEERSEEPSPQWLRELKSKKRQSQYENQV